VSGDPAHRADVRAAAEWLARKLGWAGGRLVETDGHPVVLGEWLGAPGAPTALVYGHYDVQPPGDERDWESPPFEPVVRDGRIYARGATDDKGPLLVALGAAEMLLEREDALPVNVRFLLEGEEEIGSPSLPSFLEAHSEELAADLVVSADGAMWRPSEPSVAVAARGLLALDLVVSGPGTDLHSGRHGGAVANPLHALASLLATLHDAGGAVAVAGFYDEVVPLTSEERAELAQIAFDEEAYRQEVGVPALHGEPGFSTLERVWTRPTLEVNGVAGGGWFTVVPRAARARLSCRLVPAQRPKAVLAALERHVSRHRPPGVEVRVEPQPGAVRAYAISPEHPAVHAAVRALRTVYPDREPLLVRIGGTLPAAVLFEDALGVPTLLFSFSTADERLHAPNEFFRLDRLEEGKQAWAALLHQLVEVGAPRLHLR
jgi:acetylornithine deacetylase/succinyl-diaminopimelate desuccinylase-like protein